MDLSNLERKLGATVNKAPQVSRFEVSVTYGYRGQVKIDFMLCPLEKSGILTCNKTQKLFSFEKQGQVFQVSIFSPCGLSWQELSSFLDLYALKITQVCENFTKAEQERENSFIADFFSNSFAPTLTFVRRDNEKI